MSILEVHNVSIRYLTGDFKDIGLKEYVMKRLRGDYHVTEFWADRGVSFTLDKGEMLGIIGTNGAGKSTLLKAVSGIMEPTEGYVKREGSVAALLELGSGFDGDLTVKENAYLRGAMLGYTRKFMDETYDQIIEFAELQDFQDRPFRQLSSGMKSRLAFSIASLVQPDILILDEVLSVGDGAFRKKSEDKMKEIISRGAATILVSHSVEQVKQLCTKVLWLEHGEQIALGNTEVICGLYQRFLDKELTLEEVKAQWALLQEHFDWLVVGAGFTGAVFAREMVKKGKKCLVIDSRRELGGNAACDTVEGITVHKYGPHLFHTDDERVRGYMEQFGEMLPAGVPRGGYGELFKGILQNCPVFLGLSYKRVMEIAPEIADKVLYTGGIDGFFDHELGPLEYENLRYETEVLNQEDFQGQAIVEVLDEEIPYGRIIEYKHFLGEKSSKTVISREFPGGRTQGGGCFPVEDEHNRELYRRYLKLAAERAPQVTFAGRLGAYRYYTMPEAIAAALDLADVN